ncbi:MAG: nucleotidyltransferase domain-containing protein [Lachnospiraceae bacterium]|nr:nucleotidyltransferase domain-containing protein [Lachnospiraceae bacterium]
MIIDYILDRKDGGGYNAHDFYMACMKYSSTFKGVGDEITRAMDGGTEEDVRRTLCDYIRKNEYNPLLIDYINHLNWIEKPNLQNDYNASKVFDEALDARQKIYELGGFPNDKIYIAIQDGMQDYPDAYPLTGEHIKAIYVCDSPEEFLSKWCDVRDKNEGEWYWVYANGECICSGAVDPGDIEIFEGYFDISLEDALSAIKDSDVVEQFRVKTDEHFNPIEGFTARKIETIAKEYIFDLIEREDIDVEIIDIVVAGSRCRGLEKPDSDIDIVVEFKSEYWGEDSLFNLLHEDEFSICGVSVDFNPISEEEISGSLKEYLPRVEAYLAEKKLRMESEKQESGKSKPSLESVISNADIRTQRTDPNVKNLETEQIK